jgi:TolA-binding protein
MIRCTAKNMTAEDEVIFEPPAVGNQQEGAVAVHNPEVDRAAQLEAELQQMRVEVELCRDEVRRYQREAAARAEERKMEAKERRREAKARADEAREFYLLRNERTRL